MGDLELKRKTPMRIFAIVIIALLFFSACGSNNDYSPKPRGYFRIEFPKKEYKEFVSGYPFSFEYPVYARIEKDTQTRIGPKS